MNNKKGFTLEMLTKRWSKPELDVINLLKKHNIPGHITYEDVESLLATEIPINKAFFLEMDIYKLEEKIKLPHKKLKSVEYK